MVLRIRSCARIGIAISAGTRMIMVNPMVITAVRLDILVNFPHGLPISCYTFWKCK
jgi:hypothetical protein